MDFKKLIFFMALAVILAAGISGFSVSDIINDGDNTSEAEDTDLDQDKANTVAWEGSEADLEVSIHEDRVAGYNLEIESNSFVFDPENVNLHHEPGHGHAHVYADGEVIARIYSEYSHLYLPEGTTEVKVVLASNDHRLYESNGEILSSKETIIN